MLAEAEARGDGVQALLGHNIVASPEHWQGKFASSLAHCERCCRVVKPEGKELHRRSRWPLSRAWILVCTAEL